MSDYCGLFIAALLAGCASEPGAQVCYLKFMGKTEQGYAVVAQACMSPEDFAESQK